MLQHGVKQTFCQVIHGLPALLPQCMLPLVISLRTTASSRALLANRKSYQPEVGSGQNMLETLDPAVITQTIRVN